MRDLAHSLGIVQAVAPAVITASNTSAAIDLLGFDSAAIIVSTGAIAGSGNFTPKIQESDTTTSGDFTDVAAADLTNALPSVLLASSTAKTSYLGNKRYIRSVLTLNSGTSIAADVLVVKGNATKRPVA
ncbi:hypothetical protein [Rhizobium mesoamericanum]|uniref:hypothetical protein n=1 Tax=Rhizobium mesoamericanum TaxID=1079800 RepID=UPI00040BA54D|nr:hypothetical protein [Rhizobium mesoamericanum]